MTPWQKPRWLLDRLYELVWQLCSWPYLLWIATATKFLLSPTELMRDTMLLTGGIALGNRGWKAWLNYKQNGTPVKPVPPTP